MAKLSNLKKVELLEQTVLKKDIDEVKRILKEEAPIEFTARAIGLACRFVGPQMVEALLDGGASLSFILTPAFKRKYDCRIKISNSYDEKINFEYFLLPAYKVRGYDLEIIPDSERQQVLRILFNRKEGNMNELLYYAILYNDNAILNTLDDLGINKIPKYKADILSWKHGRNSVLYADEREIKWVFDYTIRVSDDEVALKMLSRFFACMDVEQIKFSESFFYSWPSTFESRFCSKILFDFFVDKTNMVEKVKKWDLLYALVDQNNVEGIRYVLTQQWIRQPREIKLLLSYAMKKENVTQELNDYILEIQTFIHQEESKNTSKKSLKDDKPLSVAEMKKVWGYKKQKDGTLIITSYKGEETNVIIPSVIGRGTVTAIDTHAFDTKAPRITEVLKNSRQEIAFVEIPGTIKNIPDRMFYAYYYDVHANEEKFPHASLKTVILHDGIKKIGSSTFGYCTGLESIEIPNSVRKIDDHAFYNCRKLKKIKLPNKKRILSDYVFYGCAFETFDIPEKVTEIPHGLFYGCNSLKKVNMPEGIEVLGAYAFYRCAFETFDIPKKVTEIPEGLFYGCNSLKTVNMPEGIEVLGAYAFSKCAFETFDIPEKVTEIPKGLFSGCNSLKTVNMPKGIEGIGEAAFEGCAFENFVVPDTVKKIGEQAFKNCKKLRNIIIPPNVEIDKEAFAGCDLLANENGKIIINGILFGRVNQKGNSYEDGTDVDVIEPLVIDHGIKKIAIDRENLPLIVYREHSEEGTPIDIDQLSVGDEVYFGRFPQLEDYEMKPLKWRVLDVIDGKALLVTVDCIIGKGLDLQRHGFWKDDLLRSFLNNSFYKVAFSDSEREQIVLSTIQNPKNEVTNNGGGPDTKDHVFLLSIDEVEKYMPTENSRWASITKYAYRQRYAKRTFWHWELRTLSYVVFGNGRLCATGSNGRHNHCCLRPAIWIK